LAPIGIAAVADEGEEDGTDGRPEVPVLLCRDRLNMAADHVALNRRLEHKRNVYDYFYNQASVESSRNWMGKMSAFRMKLKVADGN
jgi:hypothetical protein